MMMWLTIKARILLLYKHEEGQKRKHPDGHGHFGSGEDAGRFAKAEGGKQFGHEVVAEVAEGRKRHIEDDEGGEAKGEFHEECFALRAFHRQALGAHGDVLGIGIGQQAQHPDKKDHGQGKHQPRGGRHPELGNAMRPSATCPPSSQIRWQR
jgi:hypothetical protein